MWCLVRPWYLGYQFKFSLCLQLDKELLWGSFPDAIIPSTRAEPSWSNRHPRVLPLSSSHWELTCQHRDFVGDTHAQHLRRKRIWPWQHRVGQSCTWVVKIKLHCKLSPQETKEATRNDGNSPCIILLLVLPKYTFELSINFLSG